MAQVVGAPGEWGGLLGGGERGEAGGLPDGAVGAVLQRAAAGGAEQPPAGLELGEQQGDEAGGMGIERISFAAVFEAAGLAGGAVVGPVPPGAGSEQVRSIRPQPRAGRWQSASRRATASEGRSAAYIRTG